MRWGKTTKKQTSSEKKERKSPQEKLEETIRKVFLEETLKEDLQPEKAVVLYKDNDLKEILGKGYLIKKVPLKKNEENLSFCTEENAKTPDSRTVFHNSEKWEVIVYESSSFLVPGNLYIRPIYFVEKVGDKVITRKFVEEPVEIEEEVVFKQTKKDRFLKVDGKPIY